MTQTLHICHLLCNVPVPCTPLVLCFPARFLRCRYGHSTELRLPLFSWSVHPICTSFGYYAMVCSRQMALWFASVACVLYSNRWDVNMLGAFLMAVFWQQCGWLAHDFLHHQVFKNRSYGDLAGVFWGNLMQVQGRLCVFHLHGYTFCLRRTFNTSFIRMSLWCPGIGVFSSVPDFCFSRQHWIGTVASSSLTSIQQITLNILAFEVMRCFKMVGGQ